MELLVGGTTTVDVGTDLRHHCESMSATLWRSSDHVNCCKEVVCCETVGVWWWRGVVVASLV